MANGASVQRGDDVTFNDNGTVTLYIGSVRDRYDGSTHHLRRPKIGEFKQLREALWEMQDTVADMTRSAAQDAVDEEQGDETASEPVEADTEPQDAADDEPAESDAQAVVRLVDDTLLRVRRERDDQRELSDKIEQVYGDWMGQAVELLGDKPLPAERDLWPLFCSSIEFLNEFIVHWRAVPLGPFSRRKRPD